MENAKMLQKTNSSEDYKTAVESLKFWVDAR